MPKVEPKVVLVPDVFGSRICKECGGYGWTFGYDGDLNSVYVDCGPCQGYGRFREETEIVPTEDGTELQSSELSRDGFGRYVHLKCNGGGVLFFSRFGEHHWSCASCKKWGVLSPAEWKLAQSAHTPINRLADARGAEQLLRIRTV